MKPVGPRLALAVGFTALVAAAILSAPKTAVATASSRHTSDGPPTARCCMGYEYYPLINSQGNELVVYGGIDSSGNVLQDSWALDASDTWHLLCLICAPGPRGSVRMVYSIGRQRIVMFGGKTSLSDSSLASGTWLWDPTGGWQPCGTCGTDPPGRSSQGMGYDQSSRSEVVIFGGYDSLDLSAPRSDTWTLSDTGSWQFCTACTGTHAPGGRASAAVAFMGAPQNGLVLFGGERGFSTVFGDTWKWTGDLTGWSKCNSPDCPKNPPTDCGLTTAPCKRSGDRLVWSTALGAVLMFGGYPAGGSPLLNDTWLWNGTTWTKCVAQCASPPSVRCCGGLAYFGDGVRKVFLYGGGSQAGDQGGAFTMRDDTWTWDGSGWLCVLGTCT
jgi:hypothetical protein